MHVYTAQQEVMEQLDILRMQLHRDARPQQYGQQLPMAQDAA
jgi:hypothetical protein